MPCRSVFRAALGACAICSTLVMAQPSTNPPSHPNWAVVTTAQIKPEFRPEFESAMKEISAAYKKVNAPFEVVETLLGDLDEYISISPLAKFADMDGPSVLVRGLGEAGSQQLLRRIRRYVNSVHRVTTISMHNISIETDVPDPGPYAHVTSYHLRHGKGAEFVAFMKDDYIPAMRKADVANLWVSQTVFGGDLNERVVVRPMHKLAEIDAGPLTRKALGVEGARQMMAKSNDIIESVHYSVVRLRPDLSYMPPAAQKKSGE